MVELARNVMRNLMVLDSKHIYALLPSYFPLPRAPPSPFTIMYGDA